MTDTTTTITTPNNDTTAALRRLADKLAAGVTGKRYAATDCHGTTWQVQLDHDDTTGAGDFEEYGQLRPTRTNDLGRSVRPDGFDGSACKVWLDGDQYWWQPPPADWGPVTWSDVRDTWTYGFVVLRLERCDGTDAYGRNIVRDVASIGGFEWNITGADLADALLELLEWDEFATTPCNTCGTDVASDVWREELGFCVPCQHEYFAS